MRTRDHDADPPRWAVIGFDRERRPIELVYVKTADPEPLIIHANYLTKGFFTEWSRA
ncbi:toxin-antitoxin system toxin subunit [Bifidobacterium myosotis]|uniref:Toxin-antitoxin system toxin subunit n=1 Tax=Bifidobacterium myosotis TaxID=1630166 RepID=A0A5M9ZH70_9BIFI|nr:toxin-antitoxin system toxin subunit [Bifidobacterium myosotis]